MLSKDNSAVNSPNKILSPKLIDQKCDFNKEIEFQQNNNFYNQIEDVSLNS